MRTRRDFHQLHEAPFIMPNPWDIGSARILAAMGFPALATTSAGFANTLGRVDGEVTRDEAIDHARMIAMATPLPVSADLEDGFGDEPADVARTIEAALAAGIAGCSIEDFGNGAFHPIALAVERIRAAVETNRANEDPLVLTARAENFFRGNPDLGDTIERLQAYQEAGADVLYAPGLTRIEDVRSLVAAVDRPVNVIIMPGGPGVAELFEAGATRISTGSALSMAARSALVDAARELRSEGTHSFWTDALTNAGLIHEALSGGPPGDPSAV